MANTANTLNFVKSENIRIFPCGGRNATLDAAARLTTEYNLVSIINRLVDQGSFVITPSYSYVANNTNEFTFNIGGYLFTLNAYGVNELIELIKNVKSGTNETTSLIDTSTGTAVSGKKLCLVAYIEPTKYGESSPFQELGCLDTTNTEAVYSAGLLDVDKGTVDGQTVYRFCGVSFQWCELDTAADITINDLVEVRYDYHKTTANTYVWARTKVSSKDYFIAAYKDRAGDGSIDTTTQAPFYIPNNETQLVLLYADENTALSIPADSKIRFETSRDGYNRSCRIDDGVL